MNRLLPHPIDNTFRGHRLALWIFGLVVVLKFAIATSSIVDGRGVAVGADGIALDGFSPAGADAFVTMLALVGYAHVVILSLCTLVLVRYRALVPLMFVVLLVEHLGRKAIFLWMPIAKTGATASNIVNPLLIGLMLAGLALSLWNREKSDG